MSRWPLAAAGLAAYALALLVTAPATLLDSALAQASAGRVRLAEARGTLWAGSGRIELRDPGLQTGIAKHIDWRIRPSGLLRGRLRYDLVFDHAARSFPIAFSPSHAEIEEAAIALPAAALALAAPKLAALELTGELQLTIARLGVGRGAIDGDAALEWRGAGSALTPVAPLGDYALALQGEGAEVRATLRTLQGPLQLDGRGSWRPGRNPEFAATARVPPQYQQQLAPLLRLIAVDHGGGVFTLQLR